MKPSKENKMTKKVTKKKAVKKVKAIKNFYAVTVTQDLPHKNSHVKVSDILSALKYRASLRC